MLYDSVIVTDAEFPATSDIDAGVKEQAAPAGRPSQVKLTEPRKLSFDKSESVVLAGVAEVALRVEVAAESVKSGARAVTVARAVLDVAG